MSGFVEMCCVCKCIDVREYALCANEWVCKCIVSTNKLMCKCLCMQMS
jgi:hypothetical protein